MTTLAVLAAACSSASGPAPDLRTVWFTNPGSTDYVANALDTLVRTYFDTALTVGAGTQACLRFDRARLQGDSTVALASVDHAGYLLGKVYVDVAVSTSWTWDGVAPAPSVAPKC